MALSVCAQATELRVTPFQAEYRVETRHALIPDVRVQQRIEPIVNGYPKNSAHWMAAHCLNWRLTGKQRSLRWHTVQ